MYNHFELMKDRLTDNYNKDKDSNVLKLLRLIGDNATENEKSYELMKTFQDIDKAKGGALDAIGRNKGLKRGSMDDERYRKLIKVRIVANESHGDIPTMNAILKAFMEGSFTGIQEGWSHPIAEPATLVINVSNDAGVIDNEIIQEIKVGGVGIHKATEIKGETIKIVGNSYTYDIPLPITEMFMTEEVIGMAAKGSVNISGYAYTYVNPLPICGEFYAEP